MSFEISDRNWRNAETTLPLRDNQRVGNQQKEGFAQGARTYFILILEVLDAQFLPRRMHAFDDVTAQAVISPFNQRLGFTGTLASCECR